MKKFLFILLLSVVALNSEANADGKEVRFFSGFLFNVNLVNKIPIIQVSKIEDKGFKNPHVNSKLILAITSKVSPADENYILQQLNDLKIFKPVTVLVTSEKSSEKDDRELVRSNYVDSQNIVRFSEWVDKETGLKIKTAAFGETGVLLNLTFYSELRINEENEVLEKVKGLKKPIILPFASLSSEAGGLDFSKIVDIEKFGRDVLEDQLEKLKHHSWH